MIKKSLDRKKVTTIVLASSIHWGIYMQKPIQKTSLKNRLGSTLKRVVSRVHESVTRTKRRLRAQNEARVMRKRRKKASRGQIQIPADTYTGILLRPNVRDLKHHPKDDPNAIIDRPL